MQTAKPAQSQATKESRANSGAVPGAFERGFIAGTEAQRAVVADAIRQVLDTTVWREAVDYPDTMKALENLRRFLP